MAHVRKHKTTRDRLVKNAARIIALEQRLNLNQGADIDVDVKSHEDRLAVIETKLGLKNKGGIQDRMVDLRARRCTSRIQLAEYRLLDDKSKRLTESARAALSKAAKIRRGPDTPPSMPSEVSEEE